MKKFQFAGAIASATSGSDGVDAASSTLARSRDALIDRFDIDCDEAAIVLGPVARKFHGIAGDDERIGIRPFLDCYEPATRTDLVELIEKYAAEGQAFHFTARLAGPAGAVVHGFLQPAPGAERRRWTGTLVMARHLSGTPFSDSAN